MAEDFKERISAAAERLRTESQARQLALQQAADFEAEQLARQATATSMMNGAIKNMFSVVVQQVNGELSATDTHLSVGSEDNGYSLLIAVHAKAAARGAPSASLFVDQDGNIVTAYSGASLRKFRPPQVMRPELYLNDVVQKVIGDVVDAINR